MVIQVVPKNKVHLYSKNKNSAKNLTQGPRTARTLPQYLSQNGSAQILRPRFCWTTMRNDGCCLTHLADNNKFLSYVTLRIINIS